MKSKILTVDDSKTIRLIVAKAFKQFDVDIFEAANGIEGLAVAARVSAGTAGHLLCLFKPL